MEIGDKNEYIHFYRRFPSARSLAGALYVWLVVGGYLVTKYVVEWL